MKPPHPILRLRDLRAAAPALPPRWLWHGYVAAGNITLLTAQWKAGKTTLLTLLLDRMKAGGELAGQAVAPGRAVVVSEEGPADWLRRAERFDLDGHVGWICRPFTTRPTQEQWQGLVETLAQSRRDEGTDLAVIDPLAAFLPGRDENSAAGMLEALLPLSELRDMGMGVLLLHHPKKGERSEGRMARGSGALSGFVDVLVEMSWNREASAEDRRRRLRAWSRREETPRRVVIELSADGRDYRSCGDEPDADFAVGWVVLREVLEKAGRRLTRREVLEQWSPASPLPNEVTLWRWLERAVEKGWLSRKGSGRKSDPFRYALAGWKEPEELTVSSLEDVLGVTERDLFEAAKRVLDRSGQARGN